MGMNDRIIPAPFATIYEAKTPQKNDNCVRVYRDCPDGIAIQIRTFKPINYDQNGKKRNMLAHATLSRADAEILRDRLNLFLEGRD